MSHTLMSHTLMYGSHFSGSCFRSERWLMQWRPAWRAEQTT